MPTPTANTKATYGKAINRNASIVIARWRRPSSGRNNFFGPHLHTEEDQKSLKGGGIDRDVFALIQNGKNMTQSGNQAILRQHLLLFRGVQSIEKAQYQTEMIRQFHARLDVATFHALLELHHEDIPPYIVAKKVAAQIGRAIRLQIKGAGVSLLKLPQAHPMDPPLELIKRRRSFGSFRLEQIVEFLSLTEHVRSRIVENVSE